MDPSQSIPVQNQEDEDKKVEKDETIKIRKPLKQRLWWLWIIMAVVMVGLGLLVFLGRKYNKELKDSREIDKQDQERPKGQNKVDSLPWVEEALTQPLQPNASKTRINLPGNIEDILPEGLVIFSFGSHLGAHIEGLDHTGIPLKPGVPVKSIGKGKITRIQYQNQEYMIYQDLGDGLDCVYGEIAEPLVKEGQEVEPLTPIGNPRQLGGSTGPMAPGNAELYLNDNNLTSGIYSSNVGSKERHWSIAVSPYDYLNNDDKDKLIEKYTRIVLDPIKNSNKFPKWDWNPTEPYLTNKIVVHEPNKILGEWFLINKEWEENDIWKLTFTESNNKWFTGTQYHIRASEIDFKNAQDGVFEVEYLGNGQGKITLIEKRFNSEDIKEFSRHYGLFQITENAAQDSDGTSRAQMRFEYSDQPISEFSGKALMYQARGADGREFWKKH